MRRGTHGLQIAGYGLLLANIFTPAAAQPALPDLSVSFASVENCQRNGVVRIEVTVGNAGGLASPAFVLKMESTLIGQPKTVSMVEVAPLASGEFRVIEIFTASLGQQGQRALIVSADPYNLVAEQNEANNLLNGMCS